MRKGKAELAQAGCPESMHGEVLTAQQLTEVDVSGVLSTRVPYGDESMYAGLVLKPLCRDCTVPLGLLHLVGCMVETCPRCKTDHAFGCPCWKRGMH